MKVPKVIKCYLKRCNNTDCAYNEDGDCHWGIVFHVRECHSYAPKEGSSTVKGGGETSMKEKPEELSSKILGLLKKMQKDLQEEKPPLIYCRHTSFDGEPCDNCGSHKLIHGEGRYIARGDDENGSPVLYLCGACLDKLEKYFDMMME
jgi:hypothetical protein